MTKPYRVLVTGSRDWTDEKLIRHALAAIRDEYPTAIVVVHGACPSGADAMAARWVADWPTTGWGGVTEEPHPATGHPTEDFGPWPAAGPRRNTHMVRLGADICLAFTGPCTSGRCKRSDQHPSHGASGCAQLAKAAGITVRRWTA